VIIDSERCTQLLGAELLRARTARGWTREAFIRDTGLDIAPQTLATYEGGSRQMPVTRLFDLANALGIPPQELIATVHKKMAPRRPRA
jgi:transcriptional regulator with XRE-family HTH domain